MKAGASRYVLKQPRIDVPAAMGVANAAYAVRHGITA
jgi:hypothetical protein